MTSAACLLTVCLAASAAAGSPSYARPEMLVEPAQLAKTPKHFVILDVRSETAYNAGHVPGALRVEHDQWKQAFGTGHDAAGWSQRIGLLGVKPDSVVVAYDDKDSNEASRIWWILRYWGVRDARLLNGGWQGWNAGQLPVERTAAKAVPSVFAATAKPDRLATKQQVLKSIVAGKWQLVDARSDGEFCGTQSKAKKAGAIPGAKHLDWIQLIDKTSHRFKTAPEIRRLLEQAGIELDRPTAAYCQSGGRASVMAFALELMGAKEVRNYFASWHEWGNADETPVVKTAKPPTSK